MNVKGIFSHNSDEWTTPLDFFNELNSEFHFNLDPCSFNKFKTSV
jgi:site-specific DNA-methyltransferase (adenine-specific)